MTSSAGPCKILNLLLGAKDGTLNFPIFFIKLSLQKEFLKATTNNDFRAGQSKLKFITSINKTNNVDARDETGNNYRPQASYFGKGHSRNFASQIAGKKQRAYITIVSFFSENWLDVIVAAKKENTEEIRGGITKILNKSASKMK